ncbi:MAG: HAMP domain-containing sensor histidine kinase [Nitriliruptor sp.]
MSDTAVEGEVPPSGPPPPPIAAVDPDLAPLSRQLVRRVVVPLVIGALVFLVPLVTLTVRDARAGLEQQAELRAASLALIARDVIGTGAPIVTIDELPRLPGEQLALILPSGGQLQATSALPPQVRASGVIVTALQGGIAVERMPSIGAVAAAAPVLQGAQVGGAVVTVLPSGEVDDRIRTTLSIVGIVAVGVVAAAVLTGRSLARTIVRPLAILDQVAARLAAGELEARAPTDVGPPELRRLAVTLNRSAERTRVALDQQRRFVADASHQLRTPLTGLRLRLETAAQAGGDPGGRLGAAVEEVDRLTRLVGDLLLLARSETTDRGRSGTSADAVDVTAVVQDRVATWRLVGAEQDVIVHADVQLGRSSFAAAGPGTLEQVLDNLLANAIAVAPAGSEVTITARPDGERVRVEVADRGPGLTAEQRERAFDRFWRAPNAGAGGSGLGLAIVAELVSRAGGDVRLEARDGGGLVAVVELPAPPDGGVTGPGSSAVR